MALKYFVLTIAILAAVTSISHASDPSPIQDFCVAVNDSKSAGNFDSYFNHGFRMLLAAFDPKDVTVDDFFRPGLNVPKNTSNQLGSVVNAMNVNNLPGLNTLGLIHFQFNVGKTKSVAFAGLNSQNSGVITIANAVFGSDPPINDDALAKAFQVDKLYEAFVDVGLHSFKVDNEIERGENIKSELDKAIHQSKGSIIVLSKNYASSSWCLDELVMILENKKNRGHVILPAFYYVDSSDVKEQSGSFSIAFARHEKKLLENSEDGQAWAKRIEGWRKALKEVSSLGGMTLHGQTKR
ncbi:hypothetical protein RDI58_002995 [Solanum bulbocastanum]|uniref:TIR domain-containing protein n=1 Tax=Solanum bulbocastanum TaxID=147425 RepID=A0AAN8UFG9_SOLBU